MGIWFLSSFFGNYLSGFLGAFWEHMSREAFFLMLTSLGLGAGIAIWVLGNPLERAITAKDEESRRDSSGGVDKQD